MMIVAKRMSRSLWPGLLVLAVFACESCYHEAHLVADKPPRFRNGCGSNAKSKSSQDSPVDTQAKPIPTTSTTSQVGGVSNATGGTNAAYEAALAGGKHAGTLRNYAGRSTAEIQKAIRGHERQVALHQQKIANPAQFAERWVQMTTLEQAGLIKHWQRDIARNQELADVLRGLLGSR